MNGSQLNSSKVNLVFTVRKSLVVISCLIFTLWCLLWAWALLSTIRVEKEITLWENNSATFTIESSNAFESRLLRSLALNPLNANTHLLLGRLYNLQASNISSLLVKTKINNAEKHYRLAIQKQPTWDYAWAKLASFYSKYYYDLESSNYKTKQKLMAAIERAIFIGPYEKKNQLVIIPLIFKYWDDISQVPINKIQAKRVIIHAVKHYNQQVALNASTKYNKTHVLMPLLTHKSHIKKLKIYQQKHKTSNAFQSSEL